VEHAAGGTPLRELIAEIERLSASSSELVMKLHTIVAATLGVTAKEALSMRFDQRLAASSLRFYDLRSIPAIRGEPPIGVSEIHFRSDLSGIAAASLTALAEHHPALVASAWPARFLTFANAERPGAKRVPGAQRAQRGGGTAGTGVARRLATS